MAQNINLLEELLVRKVSLLNSKLATKLIIGWVLLLLSIYIIATAIQSSKQTTISNLENTRKNLAAIVTNYVGQNNQLKNIISLDTKNLPTSSTSVIGFYNYLLDLAKLTPDDVWLKEIVFSKKDNQITIAGTTITAAGISVFLSALDKSFYLDDKKLNTIKLQENDSNHYTDFTISTVTNKSEEETKSSRAENITKTVGQI